MEKAEFYSRLDTALAAFGFSPKVTALNMVNSGSWLPIWVGSNIQGAQKCAELVPLFAPMRDSSIGINFKFFVGQPIIACSIEADGRSPSEMLQIATTFQDCLVSAAPYTLHGNFLKRQTGGVFGILLCVFFDAQNAASFVYSTQNSCRLNIRKKIVSVRPWAVDVATRKVVSDYQGWFKNTGPLKPDRLSEALFTDSH
jgi:hypothetical protein